MQNNSVFVLDKERHPLMPCHPARARALLKSGRASVFRRYPFTVILHDRTLADSEVQAVQVKFDPGSKTTGIVLVQDDEVLWAGELTHRGQAIQVALERRHNVRRHRRYRHCRYRKPRFLNRTKLKGWLPPSLCSRVANVVTWADKLFRLAPVAGISVELVKFDMQLMQDAEISGVAYQQGELAGYEVREYLLEKWQRTCAYCGARNVPLEIEHITPRSRGGSSRVSNLTLACHTCNQVKGSQTAAEFGYPAVQAQAKQPLKDVAAVNASRWALWRALSALGLPLETGTGGRTKFNRTLRGYPKSHWIDAACVGESGIRVRLVPGMVALAIKATGRGQRQVCAMNKYGFPKAKPKSAKRVRGFQTGDIVRASVPKGKHRGIQQGRVVVRATGHFLVGQADGVNSKYCHLLQHTDGYEHG